ncbi:class I SAM-dependent methyltransferase [Tundrisphaera sp. TA3]|uniref:class I SAM-dependent methyltransferase n=1 Tax=Tundrisphaera sp. TA3 TaxID=3435775 RepID=UPI003EBF5034
MTILHDAEVGTRFDIHAARFKAAVAPDDVRLRAVTRALGPLAGRLILDLGCGKGRFAAHLRDQGANVVGVDLSAAMLAEASGFPRARASARRLPFAAGTFDGIAAVEVLEHVGDVGPVLAEIRRVLRPGGRLAIVDKNAGALDARRPWLPSSLVKRIDERRGLWMYPADGPVRERWFWPGGLRRELRETGFRDVRVSHLLRPEEARRRIFRAVPTARLWTLWAARTPAEAIAVGSDFGHD